MAASDLAGWGFLHLHVYILFLSIYIRLNSLVLYTTLNNESIKIISTFFFVLFSGFMVTVVLSRGHVILSCVRYVPARSDNYVAVQLVKNSEVTFFFL